MKKSHFSNTTICLFLAVITIILYLPWITKAYSADESMHLLMAYLMGKGFLPIRDVYSHVTPYYLIFYGIFMAIFGFNIFVARLVSYLIGAVIGIIVYLIVYKSFRNKLVAFLAWFTLQTSLLFLIEGSPLSGMGHSLVSSLFTLIAIYIILLPIQENKSYLFRMFLFGFCIAFSLFSRQITLFLNLGLFIIAMSFFLYSKEISRIWKVKLFSASISAFLITSSFMIYIFFVRPDTFIFSYFKSSDLMGMMHEVGHYSTIRPFSFQPLALGDFLLSFRGQTALLILFAIFGIVLILGNSIYRRKAVFLCIWVIFSFMTSYIALSKHGFTWHYFGVLAPFFIIAASPLFFFVWENLRRREARVLVALLLSLLILHSLFGIGIIGKSYLRVIKYNLTTNKNSYIKGLRSNDIRQVKIIANEISKILPRDAKLLSCNSALYYEMKILPPIIFGYWENLADHAYVMKDKQEAGIHHLITEEQLLNMINNRFFDVVLVDSLFPGTNGKTQTSREMAMRYKKAVQTNYKLYEELGESKIYIN